MNTDQEQSRRERLVDVMATAMRVQANIGPVDPWDVTPEWARARWREIATAGLDAIHAEDAEEDQ